MTKIKFPGYKYEKGVSTYRGEVVGEGGYVYSEPGVHHNVAVLDIASMHPSSVEAMNMFGPYTEKYSEIKSARMAIKHGDMDYARKALDGSLAPFLESGKKEDLDALSDALKIVINSVYGLTSAKFPNRFLDPRNIDNIVAKRGALFMIDLKLMVQEAGFNAVHIKTDSIKIPDADDDIIKMVMDFGAEYGYTFESEGIYKTMALVNKAVFIADAKGKDGERYWAATGAMFQNPYVYSVMFGDGSYDLEDLRETRSVAKGHMYIDNTESELPPIVVAIDPVTDDEVDEINLKELHFLGRTGLFIPVLKGKGGGKLWRIHEGKAYAVADTSKWLWKEAHLVESLDEVDLSYYNGLVQKAFDAIEEIGSYKELIEHSDLPKPYFYREAYYAN